MRKQQPRGARRLVSAALLCAGALALGACGSNSAGSAPATGTTAGGGSGGTLKVAFNAGISTLDPAISCEAFGYTVIRNTYDQLVAPNPGGTPASTPPKPMLATRWTVSPDGRTYTFFLRHGATFASGDPVTAADVVYSLKRVLKLNACAAFVFTGGLTGNITGIRQQGADAVTITLKQADPIFLETIGSRAASIVDRKVLQAHGGLSKAGSNWLATHTAGSGPYVLSSYEPDSRIVLTARKDYWDGTPKSAKVDISIVTDPSTLNVLASSKQVDMAYGIQPKDLASLKASGEKVLSYPSQFVTYIGLVTTHKPLDDPRVRQALALAFPRDQIVKAFGFGVVRAFAGPIPPAMPYYPDLPSLGYDPAKARQLLQQAGVGPFTLTLVVQSGESTHEQIATVLQDAYRKIGVTLQIKTVGASAFTDLVYNYKAQSFIIDDGPTVNDPGYLLSYQARCGDPFNWVRYCNRGVDRLLQQARFETDTAKRGALYKQIDRQLIDDAPYIEVMAQNHTIVATPSLTGYTYYDDQTAHFADIAK